MLNALLTGPSSILSKATITRYFIREIVEMWKLSHWKKNGVILTWKIIDSLVELKFDPGFRVIGIYLSKLTLYWESIWINSQYQVNLTQIFSIHSESRVEFWFHQRINFLGQNASIFLSVQHGAPVLQWLLPAAELTDGKVGQFVAVLEVPETSEIKSVKRPQLIGQISLCKIN